MGKLPEDKQGVTAVVLAFGRLQGPLNPSPPGPSPLEYKGRGENECNGFRMNATFHFHQPSRAQGTFT
jgi:hypothetical protein